MSGIIRNVLESPVGKSLDRPRKDHAFLHAKKAGVDKFAADPGNPIDLLHAVESARSIHDDDAFGRFGGDHRRTVSRPNEPAVADQNTIVLFLTHAIEINDTGRELGFGQAISLRIVENFLDVVAVDVTRFHRSRSRVIVGNLGPDVLAQIPPTLLRYFGHAIDLVGGLEYFPIKNHFKLVA